MNSQNYDSTAISCKVVLIGESGVGKTSIIARYVKNTFSSDTLPTPGASFASKIMNFYDYDKIVKFDIWDTAGQEKYRSLAKIYYQNCNVAILVYDITRKSSFEEIKNLWYPLLRENIQNKRLIIAIAANKSDMYELEEVEEEKAVEFAKEIGATFKYTSAKNASGIDELFESIGVSLLNLPPSEDGMDHSMNQSVMINKKKHTKTSGEKGKKKGGCC